MCGHTRRDKIKNEDIENKIEMTLIEKKCDKRDLDSFGMCKRDAGMLLCNSVRGRL